MTSAPFVARQFSITSVKFLTSSSKNVNHLTLQPRRADWLQSAVRLARTGGSSSDLSCVRSGNRLLQQERVCLPISHTSLPLERHTVQLRERKKERATIISRSLNLLVIKLLFGWSVDIDPGTGEISSVNQLCSATGASARLPPPPPQLTCRCFRVGSHCWWFIFALL